MLFLCAKKNMKTQLILTLCSKPMLRPAFGAHFQPWCSWFSPLGCPCQKHMKTQLILTILNLHLFSYLGFPKIFKMEMSHVCGGNAERRHFCFTSAAVLIIFFSRFHSRPFINRKVPAKINPPNANFRNVL